MLDTIILLTGAAERAVLAERLVQCAPATRLVPVSTLDELLAVPSVALSAARLIAFATPVIVPPSVLGRLGYGAYNFHPGPPAYPGLCPAQYAVYDGATQFGVTVHRMVERVDAGPIVGTILFDVPRGAGVRDIEVLAFRDLVRPFWQLAPILATDPQPLAELALGWGAVKSSRRSLEAICDIPPDIWRAELERRIAAFGQSPFGIAPTVTLHGHRFRLVIEPEIVEAAAVPAMAIAS